MAFSPRSLENLCMEDRHLFIRCGQGRQIQPPFSLIHKAFESYVDREPHVIAVEHCGEALSYQQLDLAANRLANRLIDGGLQEGEKVCLVVHRSIHMVIAIMAVLKAGCQYVPLDGGVVPKNLLGQIIANTQANFVLCCSKFYLKVQECSKGANLIILDLPSRSVTSVSEVRPTAKVAPRHGAYVIYTSGTTGTPKGVDVSHQNVTNLVCLAPGSLGIRRGTNVTQLLSISFDMGQWEILATLLNGGTLLMRDSDWSAVLRRADVVISTPSILATLNREQYPNIQTVALAGEPCPKTLADEWSRHVTLYNCCGPTEVTIVNTMEKHTAGESLSIGKPVPNTSVYILDDNEEPVPIGSVGVMWAGGRCVSRGYVGLPDLTLQKFKYDKFVDDGSLMFNTGDLGQWLCDGTLKPLGRMDCQVKIKGFRVELEGVSAAIEKTPGVNRGCAILHDNVLWGCYSGYPKGGEDTVQAVVAKYQPYYAVPERWIWKPSMPLTTNGKIDRKILLASILAATDRDHASMVESLGSFSQSVGSCLTPIESSYTPIEPEKAVVRVTSIPEPLFPSSNFSLTSINLNEYSLPEKKGFHGWRALRHRTFSLYRRLFTVAFVMNLGLLLYFVTDTDDEGDDDDGGGPNLDVIALATAANLTASILLRQDYVINFIFAIACSFPTWTPMFIRRRLAKVYHIGGLHSGFAVAATAWLMAFTITATIKRVYPATLVACYILIGILGTIIGLAHPKYRAKFHDSFEMVHRFAGWLSLAMFWFQTVLFIWEDSGDDDEDNEDGPTSFKHALLVSPAIWMLVVSTLSILINWGRLRKVNVRTDVLSPHAARLYFDYATPTVGTAVRISERPLLEWHAFATIAKPEEKGFSLLVSNAGDWTARQIARSPNKIWVRGIPACGVLRIAPLFKSIVLVATGSGIGPCMPVIYARRIPTRIFWSTPYPEKTFGVEIINAVRAADPRAVIHDTKKDGRPDMVAMSYKLYKESGAEAVCIISNQKLTQMVVYAMESRGIPAYGAIWDS